MRGPVVLVLALTGPAPLGAWMKENATPPVLAGDTAKLAGVFDQIVPLAPEGYPNWASIARDGAAAARGGDLAAAKAACRSCHEQYRAKYRARQD